MCVLSVPKRPLLVTGEGDGGTIGRSGHGAVLLAPALSVPTLLRGDVALYALVLCFGTCTKGSPSTEEKSGKKSRHSPFLLRTAAERPHF